MNFCKSQIHHTTTEMTKPFILAIALLFISCNDLKKHANLSNNEGRASEKSLSDDKSEATQQALKKSMARGELIYSDFCIQCHLPMGEGVPEIYPPLAGSDWLVKKRTESIRAIKFGQNGEIKVNGKIYNGAMAPMGLTNEEIADVMNYVMNSWGNSENKMVTTEEVALIEKNDMNDSK